MSLIWEKAKSELQAAVPEHTFKMWLEPLGLKEEQGVYTICCPNVFSKKKVQKDYQNLIIGVLESVTATSLSDLEFIVGRPFKKDAAENTPEPAAKTVAALTSGAPKQISIPVGNQFLAGTFLKRNYTFEQFVVGNNNNFAYSAAMALAADRGQAMHSLYLSAQTGLGKSHLVQAVGHDVLGRDPGRKVYYISAGDFSSEMVQSMQDNRLEAFKTKYRRNCDVLLLDDVHHLSGKDRTQQELVSILDYLFEAGKRIIFSSYFPPAEIPKLNEKLRSRLGSGLVSSMEHPDYKTRLKILQKKSKTHGYCLPPDVMEYLAESLVEDVRQLESGLHCVVAKADLMHIPLDLPLAEEVVGSIVSNSRQITIDIIKKLVCQYYKVATDELISKSRRSDLVHPRQVAMYLARHYTDCPLQLIGRAFNRYHATVIHAVNSIEKALKTNHEVKVQLEYLRQKLKN